MQGRFNHGGDGKMKRNKLGRRIMAGVLILAVAIVGFVCVPEGVHANEESPVKYQKVDYADFAQKVGKTAPTYAPEDATENTGYLFAGWYKIGDNNTVGNVIVSAEEIEEGQVYAKFIPSYLTGIVCQVDLKENATQRNMRVVSLVHSTDYQAVGFNVYGRYDADTVKDGINETEWTMYEYSKDPEHPNRAQSTTVYTGLYQYTEAQGIEEKHPQDLFATGEAANVKSQFYFTTVSIAGITSDFFDATMAVKPYWITKDGTYVEGMGEFNRINDYYDKIVNVSVSLKQASAIAAGMLNITVPASFAYESVEVETGRVFEEMKSLQSGSTIKCVGNVSGISNVNDAKANDVYVNLRFKVNNIPTMGTTEFKVDVPNNGFCSIGEVYKNGVEAWNIRY